MISPTVLAKPENFLARASKSSQVVPPPRSSKYRLVLGRHASGAQSAASRPFVSLTAVVLSVVFNDLLKFCQCEDISWNELVQMFSGQLHFTGDCMFDGLDNEDASDRRRCVGNFQIRYSDGHLSEQITQ